LGVFLIFCCIVTNKGLALLALKTDAKTVAFFVVIGLNSDVDLLRPHCKSRLLKRDNTLALCLQMCFKDMIGLSSTLCCYQVYNIMRQSDEKSFSGFCWEIPLKILATCH